MSTTLIPGIKLTTTKMVGENDTASVYGSGLLHVLSTPAMIALMEQTAMKSVEACLDEGEGTVGTEISVRHMKATRVGENVACTATLKEVSGRRLIFHVVVNDETEMVGEGHHERFIIDKKRFMEKLEK